MIELKYPPLHLLVNDAMRYYVGVAANSGQYQAGDSYPKGMPWLLERGDAAL